MKSAIDVLADRSMVVSGAGRRGDTIATVATKEGQENEE